MKLKKIKDTFRLQSLTKQKHEEMEKAKKHLEEGKLEKYISNKGWDIRRALSNQIIL
jgi:hypothetical protein